MTKLSVLLLAAVASAATVGAPRCAGATQATRSFTFQTRIIEQTPSVGEYDGSLQLRIAPDGIITGYYRPNDNARFVPVTGGLSGAHFWLDIGTFARDPLHFSGTLGKSTLDGQGSGLIVDGGRYTTLELIGTPKPD